MSLHQLHISHFRNLLSVELTTAPLGLNFIIGPNGSGKTSLLEAIYYLSLARSFRGTTTSRIIHYEAQTLSLFAEIESENNQLYTLGLERYSNGHLKLRLRGNDIYSISELASLLPVQLIDANAHVLLEGPHFRRKYLDWLLFYLNPGFLRSWRRYMQALKQRNAALRRQLSASELASWTQELAESAISLHELRKAYVGTLVQQITSLLPHLLSLSSLTFKYEQGWNEEKNYLDVLNETLEKDRVQGHTYYGPHKADLKITINNIPLKDILSRGQQKLFVCAMILARGALLQTRANKRLIYLIDDLPAELDATSRLSLSTLLSQQKAQLFVTATENKCWDGFETNSPVKMFHVEHGKVMAR